jgi:hypothetical protein
MVEEEEGVLLIPKMSLSRSVADEFDDAAAHAKTPICLSLPSISWYQNAAKVLRR